MSRAKMSERKKKSSTRAIVLRAAVSVFLPICALLLQQLAQYNHQAVEYYYSRGLFLYIGSALSKINGLFGFSIAEVLLITLILGAAILIIRQIYRLIKKRVGFLQSLGYGLMNLSAFLGIAALFFLLVWGFNYERIPLSESLNWKKPEPNIDELEKICRLLIEETNRNYDESHANAPRGALPMPPDELYRKIEESYEKEKLLGKASRFSFGPPKPVFFSNAMSRMQISGIFSPFTGEPNFNADQPACELPFAMAHEKAHQRGFALEDEANFLAFLICIKSDHPYIRYSGYLLGLEHVLNSGVIASRERYKEIYSQLGKGPKEDYAEMARFWSRYEGRISRTAERVNDAYLKTNLVASGTASYNEVVALMVSYYSNEQKE